jgi:hypothetical protein
VLAPNLHSLDRGLFDLGFVEYLLDGFILVRLFALGFLPKALRPRLFLLPLIPLFLFFLSSFA